MQLTPQQVLKRLSTSQVVDVRETDELAEGMIPGARHIALGDLVQSLGMLDREMPVIAVCRSGRRSATAAESLVGAGFDAHTMSGGMIEWKVQGLPTVDPQHS
ncbi:rhodanese-like domain-containing protein [soil metagenome]